MKKRRQSKAKRRFNSNAGQRFEQITRIYSHLICWRRSKFIPSIIFYVFLIAAQVPRPSLSSGSQSSIVGRGLEGFSGADGSIASSGHYKLVGRQNSVASETTKLKNFEEFLESLPTLSVGQKHSARFECELSDNPDSLKLLWLKLDRPNSERSPSKADSNIKDITTPISLNKKVIVPDKRFRVQLAPPSKWSLTIDNVGPADDHAYYLCQVGGSNSVSSTKNKQQELIGQFVGGARLNVLVPPVIVGAETSPSLVHSDEFESATLRCKVSGEPQSQIFWRREDGKTIEGLEQRFRHEVQRQAHQLVSLDSAELRIGQVRRHHMGAYLCIASNGIQPGVSQRISLVVANCRRSEDANSSRESCDQLEPEEVKLDVSRSSKWTGDGRQVKEQRAKQQQLAKRTDDKRRAQPSAGRNSTSLDQTKDSSEQIGRWIDSKGEQNSRANKSLASSCAYLSSGSSVNLAQIHLALLLLHSTVASLRARVSW